MSEVKPLKPTRHDHFLVIDSNVEPDGNPLEKVLFNERREGEATGEGGGTKREDEIHQKWEEKENKNPKGGKRVHFTKRGMIGKQIIMILRWEDNSDK